MKFERLARIPNLIVITPDVFGDDRGFFMESYSQRRFVAVGIMADFVQDNHSFSVETAVLRGIHFQRAPFTQAKLVRVTAGEAFDVAVDLRPSSATFGQWESVVLTAENHLMFFIPRGFGHAFYTLTPGVDFLYKADNYYDRDSDGGVRWNDPDINVGWPSVPKVLSPKDQGLPLLRDIKASLKWE